jgi:hypothetical protein
MDHLLLNRTPPRRKEKLSFLVHLSKKKRMNLTSLFSNRKSTSKWLQKRKEEIVIIRS